MSVLKTILLFVALIPTVMTGGYYMKKNQSVPEKIVPFSLIIIGDNGMVEFPKRAPSPSVGHQIQLAIQKGDEYSLNKLLLEHRFYLFPEDKPIVKSTSKR